MRYGESHNIPKLCVLGQHSLRKNRTHNSESSALERINILFNVIVPHLVKCLWSLHTWNYQNLLGICKTVSSKYLSQQNSSSIVIVENKNKCHLLCWPQHGLRRPCHYSTEDDSAEYALLPSHEFFCHINRLKCFICLIHHILYFTCMDSLQHSYFLIALLLNVISDILETQCS